MDDYLREFVQESEENITELNNALLDLERNPDDEETMDRVFRMAHTLKGNCGAMGFDDASDVAHAIEDRLEDVRAGRLAVTPEFMDAIFAGVDALEEAVGETRQHGEPVSDPTETIATLRELGPGDGDLVPPSDGEVEDAVDAADAPEPDHSVYHVRLDVERAEALNNAVLVVEALEDAFDLLGTVPGEAELRAGDHEGVVDAVFGSAVEEHAIEAALAPVDEVDGAIVTDVTDRVSAPSPPDSGAAGEELVAGSDVDAGEAADMEVDELLDEFDEYDDLDALVEQMDDPDDIGELGEAGSFDDLDIEADDIDAPDPLADADGGGPEEAGAGAGGGAASPGEESAVDDDFDLESGGGALGDDAAAGGAEAGTPADDAAAETDAGGATAEPAGDEEVEDAAETFDELKNEVDPVGFDELQDELDELEFDQYDQEEEVGFDELLTEEELEGGEFGGMAGADENEIDDAIDDILVDDADVADHDTAAASTSETSDAAPAESGDAAEADPPGFEDAGDDVVAGADEVAFDDDETGEEITFGDDATAEAEPADTASADPEEASVDFGEFASGSGADEAPADDPAAEAPAGDTFADDVFAGEAAVEETAEADAEAEPAQADAGTEPAETATGADAVDAEPADADTETEPAVAPGDDPTPAVEPAAAEAIADADAESATADSEPAVTPAADPTPAVEPAPAPAEATADATAAESDEAASEPAVTPAADPTPAVVPAPEAAAEPAVVPGDDPAPAVEPLSTRPTAGETANTDADGPTAGADTTDATGATADADTDVADGPTAGSVDVDVGVEADAGDAFGDDDLDVAFADDNAATADAGDAADPPAAEAGGDGDEFAVDADADALAPDAGDLEVDDSPDDVATAGVDAGDVDLGDDDLDVSFADDDAATAEGADGPDPGVGAGSAADAGDAFGDFEDDVGPEFDDESVDAEFDEEFGGGADGLEDAAFGDDDEGFDEIRFADADAAAEAAETAGSPAADVGTESPAADAAGAGATDVDVDDFDPDEIAGTGLDESGLGGESVDDDGLDLGTSSRLSGFGTGLGETDAGEVETEPESTGPDLPDREVDLDELLPTPPRAAAAEGEDDEMASIRVGIERLDDLMNLVEGLVTQRARLRRAVETGESLATIDQELDEVEELTGELQDTVMDIRLVPLRSAANRLPRVVRDVAREQGKQVDFEMFGEDVELDRSVLDDIDDPLMHAVRNAVDHGIELPEDREAAGKEPTGRVELRAERERDTIVIEIEDDGRGLDPDELRDKAVEEGLISQAEADGMADETAHQLVFEPGFSTAEEVTEVSGRGVGMDVVASTVQELDGEVEIESERGEGTTVRLRLPVSVAISDVLFLEAGGEEYGIPLKAVEEIERLGTVETDEDGTEFVTVGDDRYELVRLADRLEAPEAGPETDGMVVRIRTGVRRIAVHCDEVRGQQEVVVKPFEGVLGDVPGLTGAAVLGEGEVVNILDVNTL